MPGEPGPLGHLYIFNANDWSSHQVKINAFKDQDLSLQTAPGTVKTSFNEFDNYTWLGDNSGFYLNRLSRDLKRLDICYVGIGSDSTKTVLSERMNTYVESRPLRIIDNGRKMIHWSERNGWANLYLYNADGNLSIGANAPLVPLQTTGNEIVENGAYNKFGLYEIDGVFNLDRLQFVSDDGVVFSMEDIFGQQLPAASSHGTLQAMCYQGEIANYLWPYQANAFTPDDKPFTMEPTLSSDVVYDIKDLKRCLTGTKLEIKDGYSIQVINTLGNAYFLWDGEQGLWLHDASRKIAGRVHAGSTITSGTLCCDTQAGLWGCTGSEGLTVADNQTDLAPADKELKDLSPADLFAYIRVFGKIEQGEYGNYVLRHGDRHIALADRFNYGFDLAKLVGKQGYVNAVYHVVGNCLILHPAICFEEVTDVVAATRLSIPEHPARKSYTIDGKRISDIPSTSKDIFIENGKKVIK